MNLLERRNEDFITQSLQFKCEHLRDSHYTCIICDPLVVNG